MTKIRESKIKYTTLGIGILTIIVLFLVITTQKANAEQNPPPIGGGESKGDWIIEDGDDILRENQEIILEGMLIIEDGGKLTFRNVTLKMKCSEDGEYGIEVYGIGEFYIYDNDNNKNTTYDASIITTYDNKYEFEFFLGKNTKFIMKNSELHESGYPGYWGLRIKSSNALIENNTFSNNYAGINCEPDSHPNIINNTFKNNWIGIYCRGQPIIKNNLFVDGGYDGISFRDTKSVVVENCIFINHDSKAIRFERSSPIIINCTMNSNKRDYWLDENSHPIIINTTFDEEKIEFEDKEDMDISFQWYLSIKVVDGEGKPNPNVNIRIQDNEKGNYDESFITDSTGCVKWVNLTEVVITKDDKKYYTPYTIEASRQGDKNITTTDLFESKEIIMILEDTHGPEIFDIENSTPTTKSIYINWTTNEPSDSRVKYDIDVNYDFEKFDPTLVTFHSSELTNLDPDRTYHFCVNSTDYYGNSNQSIDFIFITYDNIPPEIYNVQNNTPTGTSVTITWNTNEPSNSTVKYDLDSEYDFVKSDDGMVTLHEITLTDLFPDTTYHFCVNSTDQNGNSNQSEDFIFMTLDTILPEIINIKSNSLTGTSVEITWNTNDPCNSTVKYGLDNNYGFTESDELLTNSHSITLTDLNSETLYHFCVNSTDDSGNSNQSEDFIFKTLDITPPEISDVDHKQVTKNSARIIWTTNELSDSLVKYGKTDSYGLEKFDTDLVTSHIIDLTDLEIDTTYHFCVNSTDENDNSNQSEDFSFTTKKDSGDTEPPENPTFSPKNSEKINTKRPKITITFAEEVIVTEVKLNSLDIFGELETNDNITFTYTPIVDLLEGENTISIKAKDLNGNEMSESAICTFTIEISEVDEKPPEIFEIKSIDITYNSATITWKTNEKSTSQIEYGTSETYGKETTKDENLGTSHSITITDLEPSTTYHFRVKSIDEAGNENISKDYTFKTLETSEEINIDVKLEIDKTEPKEGETINITAKVTNNCKTSIEISVIFYDNDKKIAEKKISIASGKSETSFYNWKAEGKGTHEIKVVIMYDGKEIKNITDSENIEVKEVAKDDDSGFNMIYLIPIIIVPIVVVIGLIMKNRGISDKQVQPMPAQQQQGFQETSQIMNKQSTTQPAFKICPFCNAQVPGEFKFCNMCGKQIEN